MLQVFDQEVLSDLQKGTHGDCFRACVRTILQKPMSDMPHPISASGTSWAEDFHDYLEDNLGLYHRTFFIREGRTYDHIPRVVIATGPTIRTKNTRVKHAVVFDRIADRLVHDPHPSRAGLLTVSSYQWLAFGDAEGMT